MSTSIDTGQTLGVHDASGATIGVFLPDPAFRGLVAERDALRNEVAQLREEVAALRDQAARAAKERAEVVADRDEYLQALHVLTREDSSFDPREFARMRRGGVPLEQAIVEVQRTVRPKPSGA